MSFALVRETADRLCGKDRNDMENIISNYERKGRPEEMLKPMLSLCVIMLEGLEGEEE